MVLELAGHERIAQAGSYPASAPAITVELGGEGFVCAIPGPGDLYLQTRGPESFLSRLIPQPPSRTSNEERGAGTTNVSSPAPRSCLLAPQSFSGMAMATRWSGASVTMARPPVTVGGIWSMPPTE